MIYVEELCEVPTKIWSIIGGPDFESYGDPYSFTVLAKLENDQLFFFRMAGKFNRDDYNAITKYFNSIGIHNARWIRMKQGKIKNVKLEGEV